MNNYNDYYNYLNGYSDMNYMTNPNNMINDMNLQSLYPQASIMPNNNTNQNQPKQQPGQEPQKGFISRFHNQNAKDNHSDRSKSGSKYQITKSKGIFGEISF